MVKQLIAILLLLLPGPAAAGLRAVYDSRRGEAVEVRVADNGDIAADLSSDRKLIVRGGEGFLVEDRLTGPIVTRLADLETLAAERRKGPAAAAGPELAPRGPVTVAGYVGQGYGSSSDAQRQPDPPMVVSTDPSLAPLGRAMREVLVAEELIGVLDYGWPKTDQPHLRRLESGAPLRLYERELQGVERTEDDPSHFALPAEPETLAALRARRASEAKGESRWDNRADVLRTAFFDGRLWLLSAEGELRSIAEGGDEAVRHPLGAYVADLCAGPAGLVAVTASADPAGGWTLHRWSAGTWRSGKTVHPAGDRLVALYCGGGEELLLTDRRLIPLAAGRPLTFTEPLDASRVRTVVHAAPDAIFVGLNSGEWGGGLRRIDRRSGAIATIERNATGELCDGPLNTDCDPVHGIAPMPWKPGCIAAAIGLSHMATHGRLVEICGDRVEQLFAQASDRLTRDPGKLAEAASGGYGAVGFYGLAASGDALLAAGQDGLYRIRADGATSYRPWPRFEEVDGVLVSFELADAVLVVSMINGRASVGWAAPLMAVR